MSALEEINYRKPFDPVPTPFNMHLQWFAAEDEGRTEEPTEHKIKKAREEGKVAKSMDLSGSIVLLFGVVAVGLLSSYIFENFLSMARYFFQNITNILF